MRPYVKLLWPLVIIRPHRTYYVTYVNAACCYRPSSVVCLSVCHISDPFETSWTNRYAVGLWTVVGRRKHKFNRISQVALMCPTTLCRELCENGWTDRFTVWVVGWVVDSGGPKQAQVHSPGTNIRLNRPSAAAMWLYVQLLDHLLLLRTTKTTILSSKALTCTYCRYHTPRSPLWENVTSSTQPEVHNVVVEGWPNHGPSLHV